MQKENRENLWEVKPHSNPEEKRRSNVSNLLIKKEATKIIKQNPILHTK